MEQQAMWAAGIFLLAYAIIISEKIHRTIVAMVGALAMIVAGIVTQDSALHHVDFNTLGLLTGMMIIVAVTGKTGVFRYVAIAAAKRAKGDPILILVALGLITALLSALLDNVTTVLLMVPVTFTIARKLQMTPEPYLITQIVASNIGGTATLIGDPPNIMIGSAVKSLSFMAFIYNLAAIAVVILIVTLAILVVFYRRHLKTSDGQKAALLALDEAAEITDKKLLRICLIVLSCTLLGFFIHQFMHVESAVVALSGAFVLLLLTARDSRDVEYALSKVEWPTLFFFIGLFVLVGGLADTGIINNLARLAIELTGGNTAMATMLILWISALASAFVDNIPFVAAMIPLIQNMSGMGIGNAEPLWWSLALGACLGGNGSLVGASANLIVAGMAEQEGHHISFVRFLCIGFPLMLLSVLISAVYLYVRYL